MRKRRGRWICRDELDVELYVLLLELGGIMQRITGNLLILCTIRQMKGISNNGNR